MPTPIADAEKIANDVGIALSQVQYAEVATGPTHYRMRRYHFFAPDAAIATIPLRFRMQRMTQTSRFDVGIETLFADYSPDSKYWGQRSWRIWDFIPPYQHTFIACYPSNQSSGDFSFRTMRLGAMPEANGQREVWFAAGNAVPNSPNASGCSETKSTFRLMFGKAEPFAFAERSFDELISDTLPSVGLHRSRALFPLRAYI